MTTTWLIVNIVLVAAVAAIVALPALLIPLMLGRDAAPRVGVAARKAESTVAPRRSTRAVADAA
jgi:hypothetical protein